VKSLEKAHLHQTFQNRWTIAILQLLKRRLAACADIVNTQCNPSNYSVKFV